MKIIYKKIGNVLTTLTLSSVHAPTFAVEKAVSIAYSECVFVALVIQHVIRMPRILLSSVPCPALQYFFAISHK
jgi:hypothetical protein